MKPTPNRNEIYAAYERIRSRKVFKRSSLQERVLAFLIQQAISHKEVSEHSIGEELFSVHYDPIQNESKIRVYVYYLRKKLDEYYSGKGKNEPFRFFIEKGQYNLSFKQNTKEPQVKQAARKKSSIKKVSKLFWPVCALSLLVVLFLKGHNLFVKEYCWKPFLERNNAPICILADHFMVANFTDPKHPIYATQSEINNEAELWDFQQKHPELKLANGDFSLLSKMAPVGIGELKDWFHGFHRNFLIQLESESHFSDYENHPVIYLGQSKTMNTSKPFFLKNSKQFKLIRDGFMFTDGTEVKKYVAQNTKIEHMEYAMVSYQLLESGRPCLFFVSNHDIGVISTLRNFTNGQKLQDFYKRLPSTDTPFNAMFKVSGLRRTEISCELVKLEVIENK